MKIKLLSFLLVSALVACENKSNKELSEFESTRLELKTHKIKTELLVPTKIFLGKK
jgi:hypothetical protein